MSKETKKKYYNIKYLSTTRLVIEGFEFGKRGFYYYCPQCHTGIKLLQDDEHRTFAISSNKKESFIVHNLNLHNSLTIEEAKRKIYEKRKIEYNGKLCGYLLNNSPGHKNSDIVRMTKFEKLSSSQLSHKKYDYSITNKLPKTYQNTYNCSITLAYSKDRFIIYGKPSSIFLLSVSSIIHEDGTFRIVNNDGQLYILHSNINEKFTSALFIKMNRRREEDYVEVFMAIERLANQMQLTIFNRPVLLKGDFERAVISCMSKTFTKVKFNGCLYHFMFNIISRMKMYNMIVFFNENDKFRLLMRRIMYMPLLPPEFCTMKNLKYIIKQFKVIEGTTEYNIKHSEYFQKLIKYITSTWFGTYKKISEWNVARSKNRTNNVSESSHSILTFHDSSRYSVTSFIQVMNNMFRRDKENIIGEKIIENKQKEYEEIKNTILSKLIKMMDEEKIFFIDYLDEVIKVFSLKTTYLMRKYMDDFDENSFVKLMKRRRKQKRTNNRFVNTIYKELDDKRRQLLSNSAKTTQTNTEKSETEDEKIKNYQLKDVVMKTLTSPQQEVITKKILSGKYTVEDLFSCDVDIDDLGMKPPVDPSPLYEEQDRLSNLESDNREMILEENESSNERKPMDIDEGDNHLEQELSNDTKITPMVIIDDNDNAVDDEGENSSVEEEIFEQQSDDNELNKKIILEFSLHLISEYSTQRRLTSNDFETFFDYLNMSYYDCKSNTCKLCDPSIFQYISKPVIKDNDIAIINNNLFGMNKRGHNINDDDYPFVLIPVCFSGHWILVE